MKNKTWKSVKSIWLLSYTAVFLLPIVIGVFNYIYYYNVMKDDVMQTSTRLLQSIQDNINGQISHLYEGGNIVSYNKSLDRIAMADAEEGVQYDLYEARATITQNNGNAYEYGIYFKKKDWIVTATAVYDAKLYYQIFFADQMEWNEFENMMEEISSNIQCVKNSEGDILFTQRVSSAVDIFFVLKKDYIEELVQRNDVVPGSALIMLDRDGKTLYSSAQVTDDEIEEMFQNGQVKSEVIFQKKPCVALHFTSNSLNYIFFIPNQYYAYKMLRIKYGYFLTVALCLLFGGISVYALMRMNYRPVGRLMEFVNVRNEGEDEYRAISNLLSSVIEQNKELGNMVKKSRAIVQDGIINHLLQGKTIDYEEQKEFLKEAGICWNGDQFVVLTFSVSDYGILEEEDHCDEEDLHRIACLVLSNIIGELINQQYQCVMNEMDGNLVCIVNLGMEQEKDPCENIKNIIQEAQGHIQFHFKFSFLTGIGAPVTGAEHLQDSYVDSLAALQMCDAKYAEISLCSQRKASESYKYYRFYEKEKILTDVIRTGDYEQASKYVEEMVNEYTKNSRLLVGLPKCFLYDIINVIIKSCVYDSHSEEQEADILDLERMFLSDNLLEIRTEIDTLLRRACAAGRIRSDNDSNLGQEIKGYIDENYSDFNLNVNQVAEYFQYVPSYISKIFKEMCGKSILQYIMEVRMEKAQEMLRCSDIGVMEIAEKVGITSKSTFMRLFKKATGVTPGQFRKLGEQSEKKNGEV